MTTEKQITCTCTNHPVYGVEIDIECPLHGDTDETTSYTIADLLALPDDALNAMAAELRGWYLEEVEEFTDKDWYFGNSSKPCMFRTYKDSNSNGFACDFSKWTPATNLNQSRELLQRATDETGHCFNVFIQPGGGHVWIIGDEASKETTEIPFNSAHAETAAFCAAMLAMEGRLTQ